MVELYWDGDVWENPCSDWWNCACDDDNDDDDDDDDGDDDGIDDERSSSSANSHRFTFANVEQSFWRSWKRKKIQDLTNKFNEIFVSIYRIVMVQDFETFDGQHLDRTHRVNTGKQVRYNTVEFYAIYR